MQRFWNDIRYGFRSLINRPGFTTAALLSLSLGIGINTAVFSLINAVFLQPLPVKDPSSLVAAFCTDQKTRSTVMDLYPTSYLNYRDLRELSTSFSGLVAYARIPLRLTGQDQPLQIEGLITTGNYFDVLGVEAEAGRTFLAEEDRTPGSHPVVVLSHGLWERQFGSDPALIGRTIELNGQDFTVVGVAQKGFKGTDTLSTVDFWVPMMMHEQIFPYEEYFWHRRWLIFAIFGRLKPGVTLEQAKDEVTGIARQLETEYPDANEGRSVTLVPLGKAGINPNSRGTVVSASRMLMAVVTLVLVIACFNVANLLLARTLVRRREMALRLSLGASRRALIQQLLVESLLLSVAGGVLGLLLASWCRSVLWNLRPPNLPEKAISLSFDHRVLLFTVVVSLLTGLIFGLAPALQSSRTDLMLSLKDRTGEQGGSSTRFKPRDLLVAAQVAITLVALTVAGLFLRNLSKTQEADPGFDADKLAVVTFNLNTAGYSEETGRLFYERLIERMESLPGVASASLSETTLMDVTEILRTPLPEGQEENSGKSNIYAGTSAVGPHYFTTLGIDLVRGREFTEADRTRSVPVAVINETAARRFWPNQDPIGKRFRFYTENWFIQIVGIAKDVKYNFLHEPPRPYIYLPLLQRYSDEVTLHLRTRNNNPAEVLGLVRKEIRHVDPNLPMVRPQTASQILDQSLWAPRMSAGLLLAFGTLALVLAGIGMYGIMAYSVNLRSREISIRMALGAQRTEIFRLLVLHGLLVTLLGIGVGLLLNAASTRILVGLLFGIGSYDVPSFLGAILVLMAVMLVACLWPAWRAMGIRPTITLRYQE